MPRASARAALLSILVAGCAAAPARPSSGTGPAAAFLAAWEREGAPGDPSSLDRAAARDPSDPALRLAKLLLARRRLDDAALIGEALEILWRAPQSPEARPASAELQREAGLSTTLDDRILLGIAGIDLGQADLEVQARLRELAAALRVAHEQPDEAADLRARAGLVTRWKLVGPLSPYHYLDFDRPLGPRLDPAAKSYATPWGREAWRRLVLANGWIPIGHAVEEAQPAAGDVREPPPTGDVFFARADVTAGSHGLWLRVESSASLAVDVDGRRVLTRDLFRRELGRQSWSHVELPPGSHDLWVEAIAGGSGTGFRLWALPDDGAHPAPLSPRTLSKRLSERLGDAAAAAVAALDGAVADPPAALALVAEASGPLGRTVRADLWSALGTLGDEAARGRSRADLDELLSRDRGADWARLRRAGIELDAGQLDDAATDLAAIAKPSPRLLVARGRLSLAAEAGALARAPVEAALALDPGHCPALELELSLLEQAQAVRLLEQTVERQAHCPGGLGRLASFRASRQGPTALVRFWRARLQRSPADPHAAAELAEALLGLGRFGPAAEALQLRLAAWPEDLDAWRRLGQLWATAGDAEKSREAFGHALALDPSDLRLRRSLDLWKGSDVLDGALPDAAGALKGPLWSADASAPTATLLDSGVAWLHPDGSVTERVRTVERVMDQTALGQIAELQLPPGGLLVALRTHKRDGSVFDAEATTVGEKGSLSAPALQVGDDLEIDYLVSSPPPRRGLGGAAEPFYFQAGDSSLERSLYVVRSDAAPITDLHQLELPRSWKPWKGSGFVERTHVPALVDEPNGPPGADVYPWIQVGLGDGGLEQLARSVADQLAPRSVPDEGIRALAAKAKEAGPPGAQLRALWKLLSARIRSDNPSLAEAASVSLARGQGDRLSPLRAALAVLGLPSRIVLASGLQASEEPRRFARLSDWTDALVRVDLAGAAPIWLDPALRFAPFDALPPGLCGRPAIELPDEGGEPRRLDLPACPERADGPPGPEDHHFSLALELHADGSAEGKASERFGGFEAALAHTAVDGLDDAQRRQAIESGLASAFPGAVLEAARFEVGAGPGAPLSLDYRFTVPALARDEGGGRFSIVPHGFPVKLSDRYLQLAARDLPLVVAEGQRPDVTVALKLPPGARLEGLSPAPLRIDGPFGSYVREERRSGSTVEVHERLVLPPQRIPAGRYADFAGFASAVDRAEEERVEYALPAGS